MEFLEVRLRAAEGAVPPLKDFYGERLGATRLEFAPSAGAPFYHVALLVPGDRFDAALAWARERVELLADPETGDVIFEFDNWDARACYFHDAAANIVELIAHRGLDHNGRKGDFRRAELLGVSELGLVGEPLSLAAGLAEYGLELWDGSVEPGRLAFVGEKGRTLILVPPGRGWLPTGRPAEPHPVDVLLKAGGGRIRRIRLP